MEDLNIRFPHVDYSFPMVYVRGTAENHYLFGDADKANIQVNDFFISKFPVTQQLWEHIMGSNPSHFKGQKRPAENVSFNDIAGPGGFLDKLNVYADKNLTASDSLVFRLTSEAEWEYAARGGIYWADNFQFSGSNDINAVAWYDQNSGHLHDPEALKPLKNQAKGTQTHDVGEKLPNQLGIFDMSGNVWEWCEDFYQPEVFKIPTNGAPFIEKGNTRVLRGGCHHNWAIHCTVSKRYEMIPEAKDECIGLRIAAFVRS